MKKTNAFHLFLAASIFMAGPLALAAAPSIQDGKAVKLHYVMKADGEVVDDTHVREPLAFVYGQDPVLPGIQEGLRGLKVGDKKTFDLAPEEAFGVPNPEAIAEFPKEQFQIEDIQVGMIFTAEDPTGQPFRGIVKEVLEDRIILDFNHPLAGKSIEVMIEVVEIV